MTDLQVRLSHADAYTLLDALTIAASSAIGADDRQVFAERRDWLRYRITKIWGEQRNAPLRQNAVFAIGAIHDGLKLEPSNAGTPPEIMHRNTLPQRVKNGEPTE